MDFVKLDQSTSYSTLLVIKSQFVVRSFLKLTVLSIYISLFKLWMIF